MSDKSFKPHYIKSKSYRRKYGMNADYFDRYGAYATNPIVQSDSVTEMGVPIPDEANLQAERECNEELEL